MIYTQIKEIYEILPLSSYYPLSTHVERISSSLITALNILPTKSVRL